MIDLCPIHLVDSVWPSIRDGMIEACRKGGRQFSEDELRLSCRSGGAYLVLMMEGENRIAAAAIVQPQQWADRMVLSVLAVTGSEPTNWWQPMLEWGAQVFPSCKTLVFDGRPGWGRMPKVNVIRHVYEVDLERGTVQ